MNVTLYTTHCPACKILEEMLHKAGVRYEEVTDEEKMITLGISHVPVLCVEDGMMDMARAMAWLRERKKDTI